MKKYLIAVIGVFLLASIMGCVNGKRGAPCNTCNPQIQQPLNVAPSCNSGCAENAVGTGFMGRWFQGNGQQQASNCSTGNCNVPSQVPNTGFANNVQGTNLPMMVDSAPPAASNEMYGTSSNTTVGRLELPPISFSDSN